MIASISSSEGPGGLDIVLGKVGDVLADGAAVILVARFEADAPVDVDIGNLDERLGGECGRAGQEAGRRAGATDERDAGLGELIAAVVEHVDHAGTLEHVDHNPE